MSHVSVGRYKERLMIHDGSVSMFADEARVCVGCERLFWRHAHRCRQCGLETVEGEKFASWRDPEVAA